MQVGLKEDQQFRQLQGNAERVGEDIRPEENHKWVKEFQCSKTHFKKHAFDCASGQNDIPGPY